jgi:hypothetical protein
MAEIERRGIDCGQVMTEYRNSPQYLADLQAQQQAGAALTQLGAALMSQQAPSVSTAAPSNLTTCTRAFGGGQITCWSGQQLLSTCNAIQGGYLCTASSNRTVVCADSPGGMVCSEY